MTLMLLPPPSTLPIGMMSARPLIALPGRAVKPQSRLERILVGHIDGLVTFLKNRQHPWCDNRAKLQEEIKRLNNMGEFHGIQRFKKADGSWGSIRVWWVPEFEEDDIDLPVQEIDNDIPF